MSRPTCRKLSTTIVFSYGAITPLRQTFHSVLYTFAYHSQAAPQMHLFSPLLWESRLISFPRGA